MTVLLLLALVVVLPAAGALLSERSLLQRALIKPAFSIGAPIVYRQHEVSTHPVADASMSARPSAVSFTITASSTISASPKVLGDGRIIAIARNNQRLCFWPNDSSLRKARLDQASPLPPAFSAYLIRANQAVNPSGLFAR